jgi:hypothetical protein
MRLAQRLDLRSLGTLRRQRPHAPGFAPIDTPPALLDADAAGFRDASGWNTRSGLVYDEAAGRVSADGSQPSNYVEHAVGPLTIGRRYSLVVGVESMSAGFIRVQLRGGGPAQALGMNYYMAAPLARDFVAASAHTTVRVFMGGTPLLSLDQVQLYDITDRHAQPKAIVVLDGQSQHVANFGVDGYVPTEHPPEPRAEAVPLTTTLGMATTAGELITMNSPLPHQVPGASATLHAALSMARELANAWPWPGYTPCFVLGGWPGASLAEEWNYTDDGTGPNPGAAHDNSVAAVDQLLLDHPGSFVAGLNWWQGEDGAVPAGTDYNSYFSGRIAALRGRWGPFGVVISEIGGLRGGTHTDAMIATQMRLASNSGHADALSDCVYIPRPGADDYQLLQEEGGSWIHYNATAKHAFGQAVGRAIRSFV